MGGYTFKALDTVIAIRTWCQLASPFDMSHMSLQFCIVLLIQSDFDALTSNIMVKKPSNYRRLDDAVRKRQTHLTPSTTNLN